MGLFRKRKAAKLKGNQDSENSSPNTPTSDKFDPSHGFNQLRTDTPKELKGGKFDDVLNKYGKKEDQQKHKGIGRRPSVEERTMKDAYHAGLVDRGVAVSSDDEVQTLSASELPEEESFNTKEAQVPVTSPSEQADPSKPKVFHILCGRQDPESRYFTRRLMRVPDAVMYLGEESSSSKPSYSLFDTTELQPDATELHRHWQQTGSIPTHCHEIDFNPFVVDPKYTWIANWPLMNAAIQSYKLRDEKFTDSVMDMLEEQVIKGVHPGSDTISQLFGDHTEYVPDVLKRFVVDRWVDAGVEGLEDLATYGHPLLFVSAALKKVLLRSSYNKRTSSLSGCEYHSHATPEECYKKVSTTRETWQEHLRHEELCQSLISAATTSQQKDVKIVEQQDFQVVALKEMRDRTGKSWVGFRRLDKQIEKLERVASSPGSSLLLNGVIPPCPPEEESKAPLESSTSVSPMFGTSQTEGAVDDVSIAPPAREPPPPPTIAPIFAESGEPTPIAIQEVLPAYDDECYVPLRNDSPTIIGQADGSYSLPLSVDNAQQAPTIESHTAPGMDARSGKRVTCPGAFPGSRPGSLRSVTPGRRSSLDAA